MAQRKLLMLLRPLVAALTVSAVLVSCRDDSGSIGQTTAPRDGPPAPETVATMDASTMANGTRDSSTRDSHDQANLRVLGVQFVSADRGFLETAKEHRHHGPPRLLTTNDAGRSWHQRARGVPSEWCFVSGRLGFGLGDTWRGKKDRVRVTRTTDGGRHWRLLARLAFDPSKDANDIVSSIDFPSASVGYVSSAGAVFRTEDGGRAWSRLPVRCALGNMDGISFPTPSDGFVLCEGEPATDMTQKVSLGTNDAGDSWHVVSRSADLPSPPIGRLPETGYLGRLSFLSPRVGFLMLGRSGIERSNSGGFTWKRLIFSDDVDSVTGASWVSPRVGYVALQFAGVLRTRDRGRHWHVVYRGAYHWPEKGVRIVG